MAWPSTHTTTSQPTHLKGAHARSFACGGWCLCAHSWEEEEGWTGMEGWTGLQLAERESPPPWLRLGALRAVVAVLHVSMGAGWFGSPTPPFPSSRVMGSGLEVDWKLAAWC